MIPSYRRKATVVTQQRLQHVAIRQKVLAAAAATATAVTVMQSRSNSMMYDLV